MLVGEAEHGIDRLVLGGEPVGELGAVAAAGPAHEVDLGVVARRAADRRAAASCMPSYRLASRWFTMLRVRSLYDWSSSSERERGEQRHLHLLGQRQPGGVVERDLAAVGDHAVDERDVGGRRC